MKYLYLFVFVWAFLKISIGDEACERPAQILEFEEACKTDPDVTSSSGTMLEQLEENIASVVEQTKKLINIAKKKLGIKYDEESNDEPPKKCQYYQCVLRKMEILSANKYPNMTIMENWLSEKLDDSKKETTLIKMKNCFSTLAMNIAIAEFPINIHEEDEKTDIKITVPNSVLSIFINKELGPSAGFLKYIEKDYDMSEEMIQEASACDASSKLIMCLAMDEKCTAFKYP